MLGVRGCFVCGQSHIANDRHTREEVTAAINTLKANLPATLIMISDLAFILDLCPPDQVGKKIQEDDIAEWTEE